ncbi:MAG TPA: hypothetical protein VF173_13610 [Thermoanaerobaculia bacterium]|nr:hypothetical protein [Thermoanaerobaculia bacterium]
MARRLDLSGVLRALSAGLIFFMAGWWKTFDLGPLGHARRYFTEPFADSRIPLW